MCSSVQSQGCGQRVKGHATQPQQHDHVKIVLQLGGGRGGGWRGARGPEVFPHATKA